MALLAYMDDCNEPNKWLKLPDNMQALFSKIWNTFGFNISLFLMVVSDCSVGDDDESSGVFVAGDDDESEMDDEGMTTWSDCPTVVKLYSIFK